MYDHGKERHFFATHEGRTGFYVFTPLMLADGRAIFVNPRLRPLRKKDASTRAEGQIAGSVAIDGLARPKLSGKPSSLVPDNDAAKNIFYWKDLDAMADSAGIASIASFPSLSMPMHRKIRRPSDRGVTQFDLPNNHLQYALTWYGLAAALVAVSGIYVYRRRR